jgi:rubrerythrin
MPAFADPFSGNVPARKMTPGELIRALRLDLAAEEEAIHQYMAQADAADNTLAAKVLVDIADEERQHAGEFLRLLQILTGDEDKFLAEGAAEVNEMAAENEPPAESESQSGENEPPAESESQSGDETTIGSLKE